MNTQLYGGGAELQSDGLKESMDQLAMAGDRSPLAPRVSKPASAQLAVQRTEAWRQKRIATAAYYFAEKRGFAPGHQQEDWLRAEAQIDTTDSAF